MLPFKVNPRQITSYKQALRVSSDPSEFSWTNDYSAVTDLARFRGLSTSQPRSTTI
jgi:hypothetical protein